MKEKITIGRAIVASLPIVLWDIAVIFLMNECTERPFSCMMLPMLLMIAVSFLGTFYWVAYITRGLLENWREGKLDKPEEKH